MGSLFGWGRLLLLSAKDEGNFEAHAPYLKDAFDGVTKAIQHAEVVVRGEKATTSPVGLSYQKSKVSVIKEVDLEEHHSVVEADLSITKEVMQMQGNG
ncbi:hypothetical protein BHE74_00048796 [Ensete ventricosum]|nr:hypothetical protein BHE74_00048796 [Ensete ventricosum]